MENRVTFKNSDFNMAGLLFKPENFDETQKYAAIVCVHPGGGVKEQVASLYAKKLAQNGYIALAFDASHQGESGGQPRYLEDPTARVEDVRCAVDYLVTLPFVDADKIGALGICAGGGYAVCAACTERRIKAVAGISSADFGAFLREGLGGGNSVEAQLALLEATATQRTAEANGAAPAYGVYVLDNPDDFDENTPDLMREGYDYYRTPRGRHPNSVNKILMRSFDKIMAFSAFAQVSGYLTQPLLMIAGSKADTLYFSERAVKLSNGPKELFLVAGATHIDLYDVPQYTAQAAEKLYDFFGENLQ